MLSTQIRLAASRLKESASLDFGGVCKAEVKKWNRQYPFNFKLSRTKSTKQGRSTFWRIDFKSGNREYPGDLTVTAWVDSATDSVSSLTVYAEPKGHTSQEVSSGRYPVQAKHVARTISDLLDKAMDKFGDAFEDFAEEDPDSDFFRGYDESWKDEVFPGR
tara:strand:+ start:1515 stop:1997 length:483 start_codon:yes stop_codon:yes gene_type:complete